MSAKKKIAKLEKKIRKLRTKHIIARSDLRIELESEMYRANLAENRVRNLSNELYAIKAQLAILQRIPSKTSDANNNGTEVKTAEVSVGEIIPGTSSDNRSPTVATQAS